MAKKCCDKPDVNIDHSGDAVFAGCYGCGLNTLPKTFKRADDAMDEFEIRREARDKFKYLTECDKSACFSKKRLLELIKTINFGHRFEVTDPVPRCDEDIRLADLLYHAGRTRAMLEDYIKEITG